MRAAPSSEAHEVRVDPDGWQAAIAACDGPQIVVGGPGTGKTEFLVRRAIHLINAVALPASRLLVLSFGRRGTADLDERIGAKLGGSISRIDVSTFHSLASRIVESHSGAVGWPQPPQILTGPEQIELVQRLLAGIDRAAWSPAFRGLLGSPTFAREVSDFILRTKEQVLSVDGLAKRAADRDDWRGLPEFVARYDAELRRIGRIDYGTLLAEAVNILETQGSHRTLEGRATYVLVDEYQDTTSAQARLLELIAGDGGNLTVAADPYQSIYSFRGADLHNVDRFPARFGDTAGRPAARIVLTTSFRTPRAILAAAERVASGELPGSAGPVLPAPAIGRVDVYRFNQETEEAEWVADEMQRLHLQDRIPYHDMGVFVRSKRRFVPDLLRALARRAIPHDMPDARLVERSAVRFVLDLVAAATGEDGPEATARSVRRLLLGSLYAIPLGTLREVERLRLADNNASWASAIRAAVPGGSELARLLDDGSWATDQPASRGLWTIWDGLTPIENVVADPARDEERGASSSLAQVLSRWNERNPASTLADYRRLTAEEEFEARPLLSYRAAGTDRPTITTLHQCKGLEFEVVFIADAVEGVFPDLRAKDSLLGVRHLLPHLPESASEYRAFRLQEERRLAYTAMSRARTRVVWTATATGFEEGRGIPSRFLALVAGTATVEEGVAPVPARETPVTPREAEGLLRRILQDPAAPSPDRLAALTVLAEHRDDRLRDPKRFAGMRARGPDTGITPEAVTLSPSQAESYDACPRRYVLDRRLGIGGRSSVYMEFGSLIHLVLEKNEGAARDRGDPHGTLDEAASVLDAEFDQAVFGGEPFADGWRKRALRALTHLYANWPSHGIPIALEHPVELDLAGVTWHGRTDRVEAVDGGITIVDYKTSGTPPTVADVKSSLQLGFYAIAAGDDPRLDVHGPPVGAEMWFPAAKAKSVVTRRFDFANLPEVTKRLTAAARGIIAEDWTPRPGPQCERCAVRPLCPAWVEGKEAFV